ncbi:MAG: hypothetical protein C3F02_00835 [Parcubacteria group bacterium]|nr:MAG: hypothetical protein C3F02_00835 [Parcubacteria group bacterium]
MSYQQRDYGQKPPMVQGNWECSDCHIAITELPFEPDGSRPIYCKDCWRKNRPPKKNFGRRF